ncbi:MAG TPA: hypothetical protein VGP04_02810 [Pseudonocardiaceae bacterium]|nr:hypothetical protein [Pseudonocardiaceae bacterium]
MPPARVAGLLLGFAGALVIFAPWRSGGSADGAAACLTASALYGVLFVYAGRHLTGRGLAPTVLSAGQLSAATVLSGLALPIGWHPPELRADALGSIVVLGVLGTGLAYVAVLGESLSPRVRVGMVVVLAGVGLARRGVTSPPALVSGTAESEERSLRTAPLDGARPTGRRTEDRLRVLQAW